MPQPEWFSELSVEAEELDPHSTLNLYRKALRLRRELQTAEDLEWIETGRGDVLAFARPNGWRVVSNFSTEPYPLAALGADGEGEVVLSSDPSNPESDASEPGVVAGESTIWLGAQR